MKWIVQEILNHQNENIVRMITALEQTQTDYLLVRLNRDHSLAVLDPKTKIPFNDSNKILDQFTKNESIVVYGSKTLAQIAKQLQWSPGSFWNQNFKFEVFRKHIGHELLNTEFESGELWDLNPKWDRFFIRPTGNTKLFSGTVIHKNDFERWKKSEIRGNSPYDGQKLLIAPVQKIEEEYRFFVVNGNIVTASSYKVRNAYNVSLKPQQDLIDYVNRMIAKFPLAQAFVVDVAVTEKGYKVIEYNNFNTSGLYGCNEVEIVKAIHAMNPKE